LTAAQTAVVFGIPQRAVFQFIETGALQFAETSAGAVMICLPTLAALLHDENAEQTPAATTPEHQKKERILRCTKPDYKLF
jgi:hypothetical protein